MKNYCISYISNSGCYVLNRIVESVENLIEALAEIRGDEGVYSFIDAKEIS